MRSAIALFIVTATCLSASAVQAAAVPSKPLAEETVQELLSVKIALKTVADLQSAGTITDQQANAAYRQLLDKAQGIAGREMSRAEVLALTDGLTQKPPLTVLQRFAGLITFTNILWVLAIIIGVICFVVLFGHWMRKLLVLILEVPPQVYESLLGLAGIGLIIGSHWLAPGVKEYLAFTGCLLFGGALAIAYKVHRLDLKEQETAVFLLLALVAGGSAVLHASQLSGFLAVAALMSALGFSVLVMPGCYCLGFNDESALGRATAAAFVMLTGYVLLRIFAVNQPRLMAFESGALFLGSFVGYLGLLIASSKWYSRRTNYVLFQAITIAAGLAALAVGSIWHIPELQRIGGTFFVLYIVEKFMEIPAADVVGWSIKGLVVSGVIFGICMLIKTYPEALQPYLLF